MTKKNYQRIAMILSEAKDDAEQMEAAECKQRLFAIKQVELGLADYFEDDNPRFQSDTFQAAARSPRVKDAVVKAVGV